MEVTFPDAVKADFADKQPVGIMRALLDEFIAETDDKGAKVIKEYVYNDISVFEWNGNTGAYAFEFINERSRGTFLQARENFGAWLASSKGIETAYQLSHDIPIGSSDVHAGEGLAESNIYYNIAKKYIFDDIPASRGFAHEA